MLDRLTSMSVFVKTATLGSFSAAARALGISATMVTKHVDQLEHRLGTKLLHRSTRKLVLTERGQRFLEASIRLLAEIEEAEASVAEDRLRPRGVLKVNAPLSFGLREIAPLLPHFAERVPEVKVDLGLNDRIVDLVEEGWDVAIRIGSLRSSNLIARRIAPCRMAVCASPSYLERHGTPRTVAELKAHNCLNYTLSELIGVRRWTFGPDRSVAIAVDGNLQANNGDALVQAAIAGMGIIYQPTFLVGDALRSGALQQLTLDVAPLEIDGIYALYAPNAWVPPKVRAFVDFLSRRFLPVPHWDEPHPPS